MRSLLVFLIASVSVSAVHAQQPPAKEVLPAPRGEALPQEVLPHGPIVVERILPGPEVGRRNVWELLAVDNRGVFVPRVVQAPVMPYYLYNGRPYPWTTTTSLPYMPYTTD